MGWTPLLQRKYVVIKRSKLLVITIKLIATYTSDTKTGSLKMRGLRCYVTDKCPTLHLVCTKLCQVSVIPITTGKLLLLLMIKLS